MNEYIKQLWLAGVEVRCLRFKYKSISYLTSLLTGVVMLFFTFTLSGFSCWLLGIDMNLPLREQKYYQVPLTIIFISIPIGGVIGWLLVSKIMAAIMVKLGWLTIFEVEDFKKYGRFPRWCLKRT